MKFTASPIVVAALLLVACAKVESTDSKKQVDSAVSPTCDVVEQVHAFPYRAREPGGDGAYYRVVNNVSDFRECLIDELNSLEPVDFAGQAPEIVGFNRAVRSYLLLTDSGVIQFGDCLPDGIVRQTETEGYKAYVDWISAGSNRVELRRCIEESWSLSGDM